MPALPARRSSFVARGSSLTAHRPLPPIDFRDLSPDNIDLGGGPVVVAPDSVVPFGQRRVHGRKHRLPVDAPLQHLSVRSWLALQAQLDLLAGQIRRRVEDQRANALTDVEHHVLGVDMTRLRLFHACLVHAGVAPSVAPATRRLAEPGGPCRPAHRPLQPRSIVGYSLQNGPKAYRDYCAPGGLRCSSPCATSTASP